MSVEKFKETIAAGYPAQGTYITLGGAMYQGAVIKDLLVNIPLKNLNRHGLIAGATGTGKTKTLQSLTENLSKAGVPTLLMDLKGDLSGIAAIGEEKSCLLFLSKMGFVYVLQFPSLVRFCSPVS